MKSDIEDPIAYPWTIITATPYRWRILTFLGGVPPKFRRQRVAKLTAYRYAMDGVTPGAIYRAAPLPITGTC